DGAVTAFNEWKPEIGRRYRIRAEIVGNRWTLSVDGRRLCEYTDLYPSAGGYASVYLYYPGKAVDNLRVYARGLAQRVPATALGDLCAQRGDLPAAAEQYRRVADGTGPMALRQEARYKEGLSQFSAGQSDQAFATWAGISREPWSWLVEMHRLDKDFDDQDHARVLREFPGLYARCDRATRDRSASRIARQIASLNAGFRTSGERTTLEAFIRMHDTVMTDTHIADSETANALVDLGRFDEVLRRFPNHPLQIRETLMRQGRYEDLLQRFSHMPDIAAEALRAMGRGSEIMERYKLGGYTWYWTLIDLDRLDEVLAMKPPDDIVLFIQGRLDELAAKGHTDALLALGRSDEVPEKDRAQAKFLIATGEHERALALYRHDIRSGFYVRAYCGLERWIHGDRAAAEELWLLDPAHELIQNAPYTMHYLFIPFIRELGGDREAIARMRARVEQEDRRWAHGQRPRYALRRLGGEIDDAEFLAQPYPGAAPSDLELCRAIAAERSGDRAAAVRAYHAYLSFPFGRRSAGYDPASQRFIRWRLAELAD
nr:hypothetical protein [Planctomycetota bacterium]